MTPRRRLVPGAVAALAVAALSGCERPAPIVTVVNAGNSVYAEANIYCFEGQSVAEANCAVRSDHATELEVQGGQTVGVDVDKALLDGGWLIELFDPSAPEGSAEAQQSEIQDGHYFAFTAPNLRQDSSVLLTVRSLDRQLNPTGEWVFTLVPR
jgi:hypothetical protein